MGYLRQPIRRNKARAEKLAHLNAARNIDPADWLAADLSVRPARGTFLRFIVFDYEWGCWTGVFQGRWMIRASSQLPDSVRSCYRSNREWFIRHLRSPRHVNPKWIFWLR